MKRVLVITLVLVMAFASSAMAAVSFSGKFTATAQMDSFRVFTEDYTLTPGFEVTISGSNKDETDDVLNWEFSGGISLTDSKFELGKYKLGLYDDYFSAWAWGNGQELSDKGVNFGLVKAAKKATDMRARLEVPVMDLATVTIDLTPPAAVRAFVDAEIEGFNVGLAYLRDWSETDAKNVIAADVDTTIAAGDMDVNLEAAAGVTLGEDLGFAVGFGADADVIEPLNLEASVTHASEHWAGEGLTAKETVLAGGATYTESAFQVTASGSYTIVQDDDNSNEISFGAKYRMSETVAYADLFKEDKDVWATNDAPAFGASVEFVDLGFDNVQVDAASPVVADMVWVKGQAKYTGGKNFEASVLGKIVPFSKLTIKPSVKFVLAEVEEVAATEEEEPAVETTTTTTINLAASYKIGASDTTLNFQGKKVFGDAPESLLKLSIEVPF
jgi:hypothetical protein